MSYARDLVYSFINTTAKMSRQAVSPNPQDHAAYRAIEGGSGEDTYLHGLLNQVEDDRVHREAGKLRKRAEGFADSASDLVAGAMAAAMRLAADEIDPYEERDGQLVRKSDGKSVII